MWRVATRRVSHSAFASAVVAFSFCPQLKVFCRCVHEQPFIDLPPELSQGEAYDVARDALVQLNVMVRRGIEPDALMYTSLIATMGRAKLEWQAYKLFSRMLEHGVRPLPETYVALLDATALSRRRLRRDLQLKIEESLETFPSELAEEELARQREENRLCVQKFEDYMKGILPSPSPSSSSALIEQRAGRQEEGGGKSEGKEQHTAAVVSAAGCGEVVVNDSGMLPDEGNNRKEGDAKDASEAGSHLEEDERMGSVATMHIRNPTDAWSIARMMEKERQQRGIYGTRAAQCSETVNSLGDELHRLHEEELRIFLAAQRQLRHGTKKELVRRVLDTVGEKTIRDMLARRKHYFRSVEHILENDLKALKQEEKGGCSGVLRERHINSSSVDSTLTATEKQTVAPEILYTPWGILRKPVRQHTEKSVTRNMGRLERVALSADEVQLVRRKGETKELDELPESLLRRYAYEFNLKWKRRHPLSLLESVQWHCTTFLPERVNGEVVVQPTPALRRQQEEEGFAKTLENYEAFRIISQRTNNLQVVDHKEINLHLKKIQRDMLQKERRAEETMRREKNLMDAAALVASAKYFRPPDETPSDVSHVLGVDATVLSRGDINSENYNNIHKDANGTGEKIDSDEQASLLDHSSHTSQEDDCGELPPWAIFSGAEEFDISTGRFGDPNVGRYQELSDGRFKLLPSQESRDKWAVDRQLLPGPLQDKLMRAELRQELQREAVEKEYKEKLRHNRYRKWDAFLRKAQAKQKEKKSFNGDDSGSYGGSSADTVRPLPPKRRLSQILRRGRDKAPVNESLKAKYYRTL